MSFKSMFDKSQIISITGLIEKELKNAVYYGEVLQNKPHGFGLTICDEEYFILCKWKNGIIQGPYFIYDNKNQENLSPLCYYGFIQQNKLTNTNYIFSIDQKTLKAKYKEGEISDKIFLKKGKQLRSYTNSKGVIKQNAVNKNSDKDQDFQNILQFLEQIIKHSENKIFIQKKLSQSEIFIGGPNQDGCQSYGFILRYNWPFMWGKFHNYKLNGLGIILESQMHRIQGFFKNGFLQHGVIFEKQEKKTYFVTYDPQNKQKFITQTVVNKITNREMQNLRKNLHMKALTYQNDYFTQPHFLKVWPRAMLDLLCHQEIIGDMLHSIVPPLAISQISRLAQNSQNRVQRQLLNALHEYQQCQEGFDRMSRLISDRVNQSNMHNNKSKTPARIVYKPHIRKPEKIQKVQITASGSLQKKNAKTPHKQMYNGQIYKPLIFPKLPTKRVTTNQNHLNLHKIYSMYLKT